MLTVWGGLDNADQLSADRLSLNLHAQQAPGADVFVTNDTLVYDAWNHLYTVDMERTKGKLVIQATNLPKGITASRKSVDGLFGKVNSSFGYADTVSVSTSNIWDSPAEILTKTILAPSVKKDASLLSLNFDAHKDGKDIMLTPKEVSITMKRNELTLLRYAYDDGGDFTIYMLVNDNWEVVHGLDID